MSTKVKVTLTDSWMHLGTTYLPGVHTLDESIANILVAANATTDVQSIEPVAAEPVQRVEQPATPNADGDAGTPTTDGGQAPAEPSVELVSVVGSKAAASLAAAGYTTYGDAVAADDATLSAIDGIGEATIKKLREYKAA
ncbi:hypothetical protein Haur_0557 [Herpetosiphon aurantiacus DSM 785]|uniref:Helix-hairpin-helix domain-containing protein n=1 Tax=Herpetosiphon aurantiacus (strain ATCC 23779 / DSM 785 / 114-95) TaxID=316274 RepID=A9AVW7_HERA2|nr:hypothetical protein Haur_0557 [Herpetosiphon aurantiacus DSM 785]